MTRSGDVVRTLLRGSGQTLITLGVVLLLFCVYELSFTNLITARAQEALHEDLRRSWAEPAAPAPAPAPSPGSTAASAELPAPTVGAGPAAAVPAAPPAIELGSGLAVLRIPRLGAWNDDAPVVVEGVTTAQLERGPGHIPGTALPGEIGNVVLSGHRTTYGAPFARLDELRPGDAVVVETKDTWFTYSVTGARIVAPTAVEVTWPVPGERGAAPTKALLTMTTCHPRYSARQRLIVSAELTASQPKSGGPPAALQTSAPPRAS
jgi:sortase A